MKTIVYILLYVATIVFAGMIGYDFAMAFKPSCKGAQKRADDTFKILDTCQQLLGCTVTVDDLRKAQEQLNLAASCK